jgi:uncharacterized membrane-anchored protein YjiN (DUF445 family)
MASLWCCAAFADQKAASRLHLHWVKAWDMAQLISLIEINIGKDLPAIRFNGSLIGSLAGLRLYTIEFLCGGCDF